MKLGSVRRRGSLRSRTSEGSVPAPPGYRLLERLDGDAAEDGRWEVWSAEGPGGFPVEMTVLTPQFSEAEGESDPADGPGSDDAGSARHPNVISVFAAWSVDGRLVMASERAEKTLWQRYLEVTAGGATGIARDELIEYLLEAARALDFLGSHPRFRGHGRVHPRSLRLIGGGVKLDYPVPSWWPAVRGAPEGFEYAAPEARPGLRSSLSDQYSLALVYGHLRSGRLPVAGAVRGGMAGGRGLPQITDLSMLPEEERAAVARALSDEPEARWPSCRAFLDALRADVDAAEAIAALARAYASDSDDDITLGHSPPPGRSTAMSLATATGLTAVAASLALSRHLGPKHAEAPRPEDRTQRYVVRATPTRGPSRRGYSHLRREAFDEAIAAFTDVLASEPYDPFALQGRGLAHYGKGNYGRALADFDSAARLRPEDPSILNDRGIARLARGDLDAALADFIAALRLDPKVGVVHYNLGRAYARKDEHVLATYAYDEAIRLDANSARAYNARAESLVRLGDHDRALADYDASLILLGDDVTTLNNRGLLRLTRGEAVHAVADFDDAIRANPSIAALHFNRGRALSRLGNAHGAVGSLDQAIRLDPSFVKAYRARASALERLGDLSRAQADRDEAARLTAGSPEPAVASRGETLPALRLHSPVSEFVLEHAWVE
jgi:tetratricopeptide (TPR) repeat protein